MPDESYIPRTLETAKADRVTELFPYELPFSGARAIGAFIILLFSVSVAVAIFVSIPETVRAPFVLAPETGNDALQSTFGGMVTEVRIDEGDVVEEGDVLFAIRSRQVQEWRTESIQLDEDLIELEERQGASEKLHEAKLKGIEGEVAQHKSEVQYHTTYRNRYKEVLDKMTQLNRQGVVAPVEVLSYELGLAAAERDVAAAEQGLERAGLNREILETEREAELVGERIERNKTEVRLDALDDLLQDAERDIGYIRAPYKGAVLSVSIKRSGEVVEIGQELCQISPVESRPRARLTLTQGSVPRLTTGQSVKLYFQAFPYQRYGTVSGRLDWLSPAAVSTSGGREFVGFVALDQYAIPADGNLAPLRLGMGGEARVSVGKRTLIEYAFEPLRQLQENLTERKRYGGGGQSSPAELNPSEEVNPSEQKNSSEQDLGEE